MDPALLRSLERILAVGIGGLSIVLGYRLFLALPEQRDSSGTVKLPWNISIVLSRVGPGAFFALFGAAVVAFGLHSAVSVTSERIVTPTGTESETMSMSGIGLGAASTGETSEVRRLRLEAQIGFLNTLPIRDDLSERDQRVALEQVDDVKLALMAAAWRPYWGDITAFKSWIDSGASEPVPAPQRKAAAFFRAGLPGKP
jgi:hypothetical protein